jgi:hypothetical protein
VEVDQWIMHCRCERSGVLVCLLFVCFHGRPRQATDVLQPAGLLYRPLWTSSFGHQMPPRLPTRRKFELVGGE